MKIHWNKRPRQHRHGLGSPGHWTWDKRRITCRHCRWKAGLEPNLYLDRKGCRAGPTMELLGVWARRQILAMVMGLA